MFAVIYADTPSSNEDVSWDIPERPRESDSSEETPHELRRLGRPIGIESIAIPEPSELPRGGEWHRVPKADPARLAPLGGGLFRPEEEDGRSGVADVLPELSWRHHEMHDPVLGGVHHRATAKR